MTKIVRMVSFAPVGGTIALIVLSLFPGRSAAQGGLTDSLLYSWQKAFFAERDNDPDAIMSSYQEVLNHIGALPPHLQAWFQANANFGIARANAMIGDRQLTLQYLDSAL